MAGSTGKTFGKDLGDPFLSDNRDLNAEARENPGYGADPTMAAQPAPMPDVESRLPGFTEAPSLDAINDDDLLTEDELKARFAGILGMDPADLGVETRHDANLAEGMDSQDLDKLGQDILEKITADIASRSKWEQRFKRGLEVLGLEDFTWGEGVGPFEGASNVVCPILAEAVVQSQARFMEEIFPAAGPAKAVVMGEETPEKRDAKDRVANHMNYQLTLEDPTYFMESQKLGLYLPIFGSAYRKAYHDFVEDRNVLRFIPGIDMILPYSARSLIESPRKTHRFKVDQDEYDRGVAAGAYIEAQLGTPPLAQPDTPKQSLDSLDGKAPVEARGDEQWTFYETDLRLDLKGQEDKDEDGQPTGIALPYTVTLEGETGKILAIRKCWKEKDPLKLMRTRYAEYWYMPGLGSMGTGLIHWIGTLADSSTDALRAILDGATWASLQGGFKAKDAGAKAGELRMKPGAWIDVDMTADELDRAFHTPPVKEPSETLFKTLGLLIDLARRFAATTDLMVGDQDSKGAPVGTTIALIEQGSKVYSGVHKRGHNACGIELGLLFDLNAEYIPEEGYPYQVPGDDLAVYRADYDTQKVSVVPVSDPNIFSQTQRIALAQTRYQISQENPSYFNKYEVLKSLMTSFKDPEIDTYLIDPDKVPMMDPVSENVAMATGRPVRAKDGENHDAHLVNHMAFAQHPQFGGLPQAQQMFGPAMMAHIAEHVALKYADTQRKMGVPVPPINLSAPAGTSIVGDEDQQQTDAIALAAGSMVDQFMQQSGLSTPPDQDQGGAAAAAESDAKTELMKAQTWSAIAAGLANMAKAGMTLEQALMAEQVIEGGSAPAGQGNPPGPSGAFGPTPHAPAPRPAAPRPAAAPARPAAPAPHPRPQQPVAPAGAAPGMGPALHDEKLDSAPAHDQIEQ